MNHENTVQQNLGAVLARIANVACEGAAYKTWSDDFARKEVREVWHNSRGSLRNPWEVSFALGDFRAADKDMLLLLGFRRWNDELWLVPLWVYNYIKDGEVFTNISDDVKIKGIDYIDLDTRGGVLAWGWKN